MGFPGCAVVGGGVVWDVLCNGVVEGGVPGWGVEFQGVVAEGEHGG